MNKRKWKRTHFCVKTVTDGLPTKPVLDEVVMFYSFLHRFLFSFDNEGSGGIGFKEFIKL